jgi:hypothetical protein
MVVVVVVVVALLLCRDRRLQLEKAMDTGCA